MGVPNQIVSRDFIFDDFIFTYYISGVIDPVNDIGKAVALDATAASTVKLAGANDVILGRLEVFEDRAVLGVKVGAVQRKLKCRLPAAQGHGIAVGDRVLGAGAGLVKKDTGAATSNPLVIEVGTDFVVVEKL